jgi:hypothetical protein
VLVPVMGVKSVIVDKETSYLEGDSEWNRIHSEDTWVYNKLILSRILGYTCGPAGTSVPKSDFFIVRPSMNLLGMGRFARKEWIDDTTDHLHPAEFWCEIFNGDHISVDYCKKEQNLTVLGTRDPQSPLYKWKKWEKIDKTIKFPDILSNLRGNYDWINCEFIGDRLIEVHFRRNPDFRHGNDVAIPVWNDENQKIPKNHKFIEDSDFLRSGFWVQ